MFSNLFTKSRTLHCIHVKYIRSVRGKDKYLPLSNSNSIPLSENESCGGNEWKEYSSHGGEFHQVCTQSDSYTLGRGQKKLRKFKIAAHGRGNHLLHRDTKNGNFAEGGIRIDSDYIGDKLSEGVQNGEEICPDNGANPFLSNNGGVTEMDGSQDEEGSTSLFTQRTTEESTSYQFLKTLYGLIGEKMDISEEISKDLIEKMNKIIKIEKNLKMVFLLLHTMNKLVCIHEFIGKLSSDIINVKDSELLSIILRIMVNCHYKDGELLHILVTKLRENIKLGTCTTLTVSNTFYSFAHLYRENLIHMEDIPIGEMIQIIGSYHSSFSHEELFEIIEASPHFSIPKEKSLKGKMNQTDKPYQHVNKNLTKLLHKLGTYLVGENIAKTTPFIQMKRILYSYAKIKTYHEKLFLHLYPPTLKRIKGYNEDLRRSHELGRYSRGGNDSQASCEGSTEELEETPPLISEASQNVTDVLYAYSKFSMYIDELYNEILLLLQYIYKHMGCSELSQCLISLTKVHCNMRILLSKIHMERFNVQVKIYRKFFANCTPIDLMNYLLSYSKNLYFERDVYDIIADLFLREKKINSLEGTDLINILHAYSKIYYMNGKVFSAVDNILCERLDNNSNYLSTEDAIKYLNSCAKLSYKNEKMISRIIEIIHRSNFVNIEIFQLFKMLKSVKRLHVPFDRLETHIRMIVPNLTFDFGTYSNHYYRAPKDLHVRRKKWVW
ncbi:conserved Plasmodium protein, unknown function [Plasmodium knowlesi strain H]|uniref:Uncharacterized protein n=3 Tax=Plasmodium knowlesi TaxID=5850 RepID=A0A5E7WYA6_PLAKH|nr:heptatricopeptide repeat-containing protein, putative [Plasmodium knowlesi strain H]OTN67482.1 Uncharacterized protein PKNOH_S06412500 [Plasmodium knowlesi]CAA9987400.1 heptatricopeptide repeat-containing protein, putative [Plasmodium knowlesi strain H]SBO23300.1 conserved Plasmodium protein, unknown function [Plasmodium knowlesi strain H]SBO24335.1 conserved Plasmodium protein, unknown function [Plasmodium knowlesi strain H]VVS76874.1 heptatricopeptide repeat-containing protein, putative [